MYTSEFCGHYNSVGVPFAFFPFPLCLQQLEKLNDTCSASPMIKELMILSQESIEKNDYAMHRPPNYLCTVICVHVGCLECKHGCQSDMGDF